MNKLILILLIFCAIKPAEAQEFSFQMFFHDAAGNRDTITLGYDIQASDSIDPAFGEINIIALPLDSGLDVRITNEWKNRWYNETSGTFHTKKQISHYDCPTPWSFDIQSIDIVTHHWPVTASWNKSLFNDTCRSSTVFTSVHPGGWWDVGCISDLYKQDLLAKDSVTFTSNASASSLSTAYIKNNDTIPVFFQAFMGIHAYNHIVIQDFSGKVAVYPNPVNNTLYIETTSDFGNIIKSEIYSIFGQKISDWGNENEIQVSSLENGLYFLIITNQTGLKFTTRFNKI